ncbi:hypothetical protein [Flavisphingomonas formosensis]|uniref:hypothetical protein n=1 Tax=Flavisphingomonas formosensis TaxID=861534 RepID=UPI0012FCD9F1|nr:hypothetical protein [Sphingomonas formosensis]
MTPSDESHAARLRYRLIVACHLAGTALALFGLVVWYGDLLQVGGWPELGIALFLAGIVATFGLPRLLARRWRSPPAP